VFSNAVSSEPQEIRPTLLYNIIQSLVAFPLIHKYVTVNDIEWLFYVKFYFAPVCL